MTAINMPNSPNDGDTYIADNGINYVYDATHDRWLVQAEAASGANVWARNTGSASVFPIYEGDAVVLKNGSGVETVDIDPQTGITLSAGLKFTGEFDIDNLTSLP